MGEIQKKGSNVFKPGIKEDAHEQRLVGRPKPAFEKRFSTTNRRLI
jgi:hypothetical protein